LNLKNIHNVYFIGIGGIGMSAIATYFKSLGKNVAGFDKVESEITKTLQNSGVAIHFTDAVDLIPLEFLNKEHTLIVYTPAIPLTHSELNYFINNLYTVVKRSAILGEITKNSFCMAVAGTHGKTTTSTILGHILKEANVNATSFLGGISENYNSNLILGGSKITVVEADEFDKSFLTLSPTIACITSIDADHLDVYGNHSILENSFKEFASKVSDTLIVRKGLPIKGVTYGINDGSDYEAKNISIERGSYIFDVQTPLELIKNIKINLPGKHNVLNTVAALAIATSFGVPLPSIAKALLSFKGIKRRFSYKIKTDNLVLIDDYAHHPTEINAVAQSVKELYPSQKVLGVFQPHLYSRTRDFMGDFAKSLSQFDELILLDIYPAREEPIAGVSSENLLSKIKGNNSQLSSKDELVANIIKSNAQIIVIMGAGDIGDFVDVIKNNLSVEN
jgi:UDP-N-acetylmuramate--alanine ligase